MNTGTKIALGVGIPAGVVIMTFVIVALVGGIEQGKSINEANLQHQGYCQNWSLQLDRQLVDLEGQFIQTQAEYDAYNQQVNQYNAECAS